MSGSNQHAKYRQLIYDQELASRFRELTTAVTDSEVKIIFIINMLKFLKMLVRSWAYLSWCGVLILSH